MANPAAIMSTLIKVDGMSLAVTQMKDYDALSRKAAAGADVMSGAVAKQDSKLQALGATAKSTGRTLTASLTVPMVLIAGLAIKMASDYTMSVNKIATLSSGSAKDVNMLRDAVLQLGGETAKTPKELADALYIIESGGIHGKAALDLLTESAKASAVGLGNTSVIARGATGVLNAFAAQGVTAKRVVDDMGEAIKLGMVPTEELASTLGRVSVVAATMGVSVESMLGSIAAMTRVGVPAAVAAQQLRTALVGFEKPAASVNAALHSVNLSAAQVRDSFKTQGIQATFEMLWEAAGKGTTSVDQQTAKYAAFFQAIQRGGIAALQAVGGNAAANDAIMKDMANHVDVIGASFKRLQQQPSFQLAAGLQSIKNDLIILGEVLLPIIAPALVKVANAIQSVFEWFHSLDPIVQKILLGFAGFLVVIGPIVGLIGTLITVFTALGAVMGGIMAVVFSPWILLIGAIAAGAYLIINNWSTVGPAIMSVVGPVITWLKTVWPEVEAVATSAPQWIVNAWANASQAIKIAWSDATNWLITAWRNVNNYIGPTLTNLGIIFSTTFNVIKAILTPFAAAVITAFHLISPAIDAVAGVVGTVFVHAFQTAEAVIGPIIKGMEALISGGMNVMRGVIAVFAGLLTGDFSKMWKGIEQIFGGAWTAISGIISNGISVAEQIIKGAYNAMYSAGHYIITGLVDGFFAVMNTVLGIIHTFVQDIVSVIAVIPGVSAPKIPSFTVEKPKGFYKGGMVDRPSYIAGEEGPQHPEVILATNPAYRKRNLDLFAKAGSMLGVPGFALGGVAGEVEGLAGAAGFNRVAIAGLLGNAQQESSMNPNTPGGGLWQQISNFGMGTGGTLQNQWQYMLPQIMGLRSAMNAASSPGKAADIFEIGFEKAGIPALANRESYATQFYQELMGGGGGIGLGGIAGAIGGLASSVLGFTLGGIKDALNAIPKPKLPSWLSALPGKLIGDVVGALPGLIGSAISGSSGPGAVPSTGQQLPGGLGVFDGLRVADWIIPELQYAQAHGWSGRITSGYRPGFDPNAPGGSEHALINYPGGAVDFGGMIDPMGLENKLRFMTATQGYTGLRLLPAIGFRDDGHMSGTGHYKGGIYAGSFAGGGIVNATGPTLAVFGENGPETAMFIPGYATGGISSAGSALSGNLGALTGSGGSSAPIVPATWEQTMLGMPGLPSVGAIPPSTIGGINAMQNKIKGFQTTISGLQSKYSVLDAYYTSSSQAPTLVDSNGNIDMNAVNARIAQLGVLQGIAQQIFDTYQLVVVYTQLITQGYTNMIAKLHADIAAINVTENKLIKYRDNVQNKILPSLKKALAAIHTTGLKGAALASAQAHQTSLRNQITDYTTKLSQTKSSISAFDKQKSGFNTTIGTYQSSLDSIGLDGIISDRDNAWLNLLNVKSEAGSVLSGAQTTAASMAPAAGTAASVATTAATVNPADALTQQLLTISQQTLAVSQAQYATLSALPPFGGSFAEGGIVPGPLGSPRTIIAHGGEPVGAAPQVHIHFANGMDWLKQFVSVEVQSHTRGQSRTGTRASTLPGSRSGM